MLLDGDRTSGQDVRTQNVTAAMAIANIVKSSLGPVGLDKMLVDEIGDVTITNDGATILAQLAIEHPAAKVLVELAQLQDQEVGDGTTSVVIVAAELLKRANELVKKNIHPTVVMAGYRLACKESVKFIKENLIVKADSLGADNLINAGKRLLFYVDMFVALAVHVIDLFIKLSRTQLFHFRLASITHILTHSPPLPSFCLLFPSTAKTSMSSKILGAESDFFSNLAVTAAQRVKLEKNGKIKCPISNIHILKSHGQSALDSNLVDGFALNATKAAQGMPSCVKNAKVALLDFNLQKHKLQMGVEIVVTDTKQVEEIRQREMDITREKIMHIINAGARVILTTKGIDDLCLKYFVEAGAIAVRRVKPEDLKRIAKATGGSVSDSV